jgi:3-oxoacyl-[acyl-carrier protein] reductase
MKQDNKPLILITGVTSGVGLSLTHYLANRFRIIALGRNSDKLHELYTHHRDVTYYAVDLSRPDETVNLVKKIFNTFHYIPYLINNAGVNIKANIVDVGYDQIMSSINVNAIAPLIVMQHILPMMKINNYGRIINITSGAPLNCFPGFVAYSTSKGMLNALTVTTAREYAEFNIKINLMSPGPVRSNMAPQASMDPAVCHPTVDYLLKLDENGPTGKFFWLGYEIPLFPDLEGIEWLEGKADKSKYRKVVS